VAPPTASYPTRVVPSRRAARSRRGNYTMFNDSDSSKPIVSSSSVALRMVISLLSSNTHLIHTHTHRINPGLVGSPYGVPFGTSW